MSTNTKAFKTLVREHILERLDSENYQDECMQLNALMDDFNNWYNDYERKMIPNKYEAFSNFLDILPSSIHLDFSSYEIMLTLKDWFEKTEHVFKERSEDKEHEIYHHLIIRELRGLCKINGISF